MMPPRSSARFSSVTMVKIMNPPFAWSVGTLMDGELKAFGIGIHTVTCGESKSVRDWETLPIRLDMIHRETSEKGDDKSVGFARQVFLRREKADLKKIEERFTRDIFLYHEYG